MTSLLPFLALLMAATQPAERSPTVTHGIFYAQDAGSAGISETNVIPLRTGQCYGWALRVEPDQRSVTIREVFELPALGNWNVGSESSAVSRNARTAVTQFEAALGEGVITHGWCVAEGDPAGPHRIRVYHGENLLHDFRFTVRAGTH